MGCPRSDGLPLRRRGSFAGRGLAALDDRARRRRLASPGCRFPDVVAVDTEVLASNLGATWEAITAACDLLHAGGLTAAVQGLLEVDTAARITLIPVAIVAAGGTVPPDLAAKWWTSSPKAEGLTISRTGARTGGLVAC